MSSAKISPNKPFVVFLYGFPGSGKTAFARQLAEEINLAHLQQDRLNVELYGDSNAQNDKQSRNAMDYMSREFLRAGVSVIYDSNVPRLGDRRLLRDEVRKSKATPVLVWLQIDPDTAFNRVKKRDKRRADDHYAREYEQAEFEAALNRMQNPDNEDYVVISGKHTFHTQRAAVFKKLYELGILTPNLTNKTIAKPELVNLVPQSMSKPRTDIVRRNIHIR